MWLKRGVIVAVILLLNCSTVAFAANPGTVLPDNPEGSEIKTIDDCRGLMNKISMKPDEARAVFKTQDAQFDGKYAENDILACGIRTGDIKLWMVPYYVRFLLEFVIAISGLVSIGGIVYGGYMYLFAGLGDNKDQGKRAILYSVGGMILTLVSWALVNIVISLVAS